MKKIKLGFPSFLLVIVAAIILTGITRLISFYVPFMSNFTPMGAMAIFGGTYFAQKWKAGLLSVITLFVTDIFINYLYTAKLIVWYGNSALWLYASLIIMVFIGSMIKKVNVTSVLLASLASVAVHWLLTDIEPWINSSYYDKGLLGYGESLLMAIPFERNMLIADAVFGAALYGGYEVFKARAIAKADVARQSMSATASY
ncbi:hypothetical protein LLH06_09240 [Mucilaginibacter daejeonensis]|uniref:DUF6580 family putative transport protein n=1 Tax=Mucilaginibacter daejeonensis TaxID=398049 RepID=UPI001D178EFD|nr:DUF6580 family putative transport protein [Mucilaginibacter daejeonensis]UEG55145.1 hypothetical protein LLH06_09240 [Mucilaginibacter daejeonensis]